jgi:hypothetical protein
MLLVCLLPSFDARATDVPHKRSTTARSHFKRGHPCPSTGMSTRRCPGYVIDHIDPLECGGADAPFNMQWQTIAEAKAKDTWERNCRLPRPR